MSTAPTVELLIWMAIKTRIESLPLGYPKAWPSMPFTPPTNSTGRLPFLRIGDVRANPARQLIGNGKPYRRTGRLIITLVYPIGLDSELVVNQLAGRIADHFNDTTKMRYGNVCVSVPNNPHVQPGYEDNGYWSIPVSIQWECFA